MTTIRIHLSNRQRKALMPLFQSMQENGAVIGQAFTDGAVFKVLSPEETSAVRAATGATLPPCKTLAERDKLNEKL